MEKHFQNIQQSHSREILRAEINHILRIFRKKLIYNIDKTEIQKLKESFFDGIHRKDFSRVYPTMNRICVNAKGSPEVMEELKKTKLRLLETILFMTATSQVPLTITDTGFIII